MEGVEIWLKSTIPGIVLLGMIGSLLAAVLIWLSGRVIPPVRNAAFDLFGFNETKANAVLDRVVVDTSGKSLITFCAIRIAKMIGYMSLLVMAILYNLAGPNTGGLGLLLWFVLISIMGYNGVKELYWIRFADKRVAQMAAIGDGQSLPSLSGQPEGHDRTKSA